MLAIPTHPTAKTPKIRGAYSAHRGLAGFPLTARTAHDLVPSVLLQTPIAHRTDADPPFKQRRIPPALRRRERL